MDKKAIVRIGLLIYALINQSLNAAGYNTLPIAEGEVETLLSVGFTVVTAIIAAVTDNRAKKADTKTANKDAK